MVRHFTNCGVNNIQPVILERVRSSDPFIRKAREQFYIENYYFFIYLPSLPIIHHHCKNLTNQLLVNQIQIRMILLVVFSS